MKRISHRTPFVFAALSAVMLMLSGCGVVAVEGLSVVATDKAASDHIVSWLSGKDCSVVSTESGQRYCAEDRQALMQPNLYCYQELASVTCYKEPDPRRLPDERLTPKSNTITP